MIILKGEITDLHNEERIFSGWGSVQVVDRQGDVIPISEFKPIMEKVMKRGGLIVDTHTNHHVGKIIDYEFKKTPDGKEGLYLTAKIFNDYPTDDEVWKGILNGEYTGFSLGGRAGKKDVECNDMGCHNILKDIEVWEFSIVKKPANQLAVIDKIKKDEPLTSDTEGVQNEVYGDNPIDNNEINKFVRQCGSQWCVYSHTGKILGRHDTKESANRQLRAIEVNKKVFDIIDTMIRKFRVDINDPKKHETGGFRVYIDDPKDAPEGAQVKRGARGKYYYESKRERMYEPKRKKKKEKEEYEVSDIKHQSSNIESERDIPTKRTEHTPQRTTGTPQFRRRRTK